MMRQVEYDGACASLLLPSLHLPVTWPHPQPSMHHAHTHTHTHIDIIYFSHLFVYKTSLEFILLCFFFLSFPHQILFLPSLFIIALLFLGSRASRRGSSVNLGDHPTDVRPTVSGRIVRARC